MTQMISKLDSGWFACCIKLSKFEPRPDTKTAIRIFIFWQPSIPGNIRPPRVTRFSSKTNMDRIIVDFDIIPIVLSNDCMLVEAKPRFDEILEFNFWALTGDHPGIPHFPGFYIQFECFSQHFFFFLFVSGCWQRYGPASSGVHPPTLHHW